MKLLILSYVYAPDRKAERPIAHLSGFKGVLQVDGYGGYKVLPQQDGVRLAFCWSHVRRSSSTPALRGAYRSRRFRNACSRFGLKITYTRPYAPRTNGKAERFIQTALREWAYAKAYDSSLQRAAELPYWRLRS